MTSIGVRELRQRASEWLRRVEQGDAIEITDRGRPVAVLMPPPDGGPIERMRARGEIDPATADLADLPEPLTLAPAIDLPSKVLSRLRRHER